MPARGDAGLTLAWTGRAMIAAALLCLAACNGIDFGDNPRPDTRKETGPLTIPPPPAADRPLRGAAH
jgi:hypothetical protein